MNAIGRPPRDGEQAHIRARDGAAGSLRGGVTAVTITGGIEQEIFERVSRDVGFTLKR
jgi:hypothetical protein